MTLDHDLTQQVRDWLRDGVTEVPDRVLAGVFAELPTVPQRRTTVGRPAWRSMSAVTPLRFSVAAAMLVLAVVGLDLVGPPGPGPGGPPGAASPSPRAPIGRSPEPAPAPASPSVGPAIPQPTNGLGPLLATSPVPGARLGELTLTPHPSSPTWLTFIAGTPIDGRLRTADPLSSPGVPIRLVLYRSDPVEGLIATWSAAHRVDAGQTQLDIRIDGQEPGRYRLVAYHAMTEPLAVLDLAVEGEPSALPARPSVPPDWRAARSMSGDLELWLPADFGAVVDHSSLVANPPDDGSPAWISVLAESPAGVDLQPASGASLARWLDDRWFTGDGGDWSRPMVQALRLPAGEAVQVIRTLSLEEGSKSAVLYAIRTADGIGVLLIDGPTDQMGARAEELELIPRLVRYPSPPP